MNHQGAGSLSEKPTRALVIMRSTKNETPGAKTDSTKNVTSQQSSDHGVTACWLSVELVMDGGNGGALRCIT